MLEIYRWCGGIARNRRRDVLLHEPVVSARRGGDGWLCQENELRRDDTAGRGGKRTRTA